MKNIVSVIEQILIVEDIEGYIEIGAPGDEYEDEAVQIGAAISLLDSEQLNYENILSIVALVWAKSFNLSGEDIALRREALERVAAEVLERVG